MTRTARHKPGSRQTPSRTRRLPQKLKLGDLLAATVVLHPFDDDPAAHAANNELRQAAENGSQLANIEITKDPLPDPAVDSLPPIEQERIKGITRQIIVNPAPLVAHLEMMVQQYPHIPLLHNHLAGALNAAGQYDRAATVIAKMYAQFPDYIFGFANQIMTLLGRGAVDEARRLIEPDPPRRPLFLPTSFAPTRDVFHVAEVVCYCAMVGHYLISTDRAAGAKSYLDMCRHLAPDHAQTRSLQTRLKRLNLPAKMLEAIERTEAQPEVNRTGYPNRFKQKKKKRK